MSELAAKLFYDIKSHTGRFSVSASVFARERFFKNLRQITLGYTYSVVSEMQYCFISKHFSRNFDLVRIVFHAVAHKLTKNENKPFAVGHDLGIKPFRPEASFLVWLDCRDLGLSQDELMDFFRTRAKIIPSNGASYGSGGEGFVRLNIGVPASVLDTALSRILTAFKQ